jgi:hypothetical protein
MRRTLAWGLLYADGTDASGQDAASERSLVESVVRGPRARMAAPLVRTIVVAFSDANVMNSKSERLIKANHSKGWDAKPLAYVL